jgi:very-short-patch-repair endonuclease
MSDYRDNLFHKTFLSNFSKARNLRKSETPAEKKLWEELRNRKLLGCKFRRQHALGYFIADFYCHELPLVIELDGRHHNEKYQKQYDENRDFSMELSGVKVLRFSNDEILKNISAVLEKIREGIKAIEKRKENTSSLL